MLLIGYGTLLNTESLGRTIGTAGAQAKVLTPVVIREFIRLFNLRPDHYEPSFRFSVLPIEAGAMNVQPRLGATLNAVAFQVTDEELLALDLRERYYRRLQVPVYRFPDQVYLDQGAIYACHADSRWIECDPERLLPRWDDIVQARAGSYAIDPAFGRMFDETTYLADGRTLVIDRYRDQLPAPHDVKGQPSSLFSALL